jgi:hypothetical protein
MFALMYKNDGLLAKGLYPCHTVIASMPEGRRRFMEVFTIAFGDNSLN